MKKKHAEPPDDYEGFCKLLATHNKGLSKQLKAIARFVTDNPNETALETATEVSRQLGIQPSSLIRFAQALGYPGFSQIQAIFRERLRGHLAEATTDYRDRIESLRQKVNGGRLPAAITAQFAEANRAALQQLTVDLDMTVLARAATGIRRAANVYVFGQRRSFPAAVYLFYMLEQLEGNVHLIDSVGGMQQQQSQNIRKQDVCIIVTFPTYSEDAITLAREARARGAMVIAITDSPVSSVVEFSEVFFCCDRTTVSGFRTVAATMALAQIISIVAVMGDKKVPKDD